jgi:arsenate reductase-like glutaredoxin family protein
LAGVGTLIAARGKAVAVFDLASDRPADDELLAHLIGPTGNLRAPTMRVGAAMVVGFNPEAYRIIFGVGE